MATTFLTVSDVADSLQLSAQAVRSLIQSGDLPAIQVGPRRLWRIPEAAFDQYVERQLARTRAMIAGGAIDEVSGDDEETPGRSDDESPTLPE